MPNKMFISRITSQDRACLKVINQQGAELSVAFDNGHGGMHGGLTRARMAVFANETDSQPVSDEVFSPSPEEFLQALAEHLGYKVQKIGG